MCPQFLYFDNFDKDMAIFEKKTTTKHLNTPKAASLLFTFGFGLIFSFNFGGATFRFLGQIIFWR